MPASIAQNTPFSRFTGATETFTFASTPTAGNVTGIMFWGWVSGGYTLTSVTDNQGNTYTVRDSGAVAGDGRVFIAYATNVTSSGTFTISVAGSSSAAMKGNFFEVAGLPTAPAQANASGVATSGTASETVTAPGAGIALAAMTIGDGGSQAGGWHPVVPSGYTELAIETGSGFASDPGECAYKVLSAGGSETATWSHDAVSASHGWGAVLVALGDAGGGGLPVEPDPYFQVVPQGNRQVVTIWG